MKSLAELGVLKSGEVVYDRPHSHLDQQLVPLLLEGLLETESHSEKIVEREKDFGRIIGKSALIKTKSDDEIIYAKRRNRKGYSRLIKNRFGDDETTMYFKLLRSSNPTGYLLVTAFIGRKTLPEPVKGKNNDKVNQFWSNHALAYDPNNVINNSETSVIPEEFKLG